MTSPFLAEPDFFIWAPALPPADLSGFGLSLEEWATRVTGASWDEGVVPDPDDYDRIHRLLMLVGAQDYPSSVPWERKWIHYPDRTDMPLPVMLSDNDVHDDGSDDELREYLRVGDPLLLEEPIVEEVHTPMGRALRALAYSPLHEGDKVNICATYAYAWRVEWPDGDVSIVRLYTMEDPTRVLKAVDDIHALAMTLRIREDD